MLFSCMCEQQLCPLNTTHMPHMQISSHADMRQLHHIHASYETTAINKVTRNTFINTLHIIGICPRDLTLLHTTVKKNQHLFSMLLPFICQQQICPLNGKCMLYVQIAQCQYIHTYKLASINNVTRNTIQR